MADVAASPPPATPLAAIRQAHPEYADLSDQQLADGIYKKFYSDLPRDQFDAKIGLPVSTPASSTPPPIQANVKQAGPAVGFFGALANAVTGAGKKQPGRPDIGWTPVPEEKDQQFEGPISGIANALPQGVRNWLGATEKAGAIAYGEFDPDQLHQAAIIAHNVPTAQFRRDEFGNLQARYKPDADPEKGWGYINQPGVSGADAVTFPAEIEKFLIASKVPGLKVADGAGLLTAAAKNAGAGALSMGASQILAMPVGGPGPNVGDVVASGVGAGAGSVFGAGLSTATKAVPGLVGDAVTALADRLPGGAARAAARTTLAEQAQQAAMDAARANAEAITRTNAAQTNMQGAALEDAIKSAGDEAAAKAQADFAAKTGLDPVAQANKNRAASFGVKLSNSQATGDREGQRFMYEAQDKLHGPGAQTAAIDFLSAQDAALPGAVKSAISDSPTVLDTPSGVGDARGGLLAAKAAADDAEEAAWQRYRAAVKNVRTRATTPTIEVSPAVLDENGNVVTPAVTRGGKPGGVQAVTGAIQDALAGTDGAHMDLPEVQAAYPRVQNVLSLAQRMGDVADTSSMKDVPDVDRVVKLKRFIDGQWDASDNPAERRLLTKMGTATREWLKGTGADTLTARGAGVTAAALKDALAISEQSAKTFRENPIMQDILATNKPIAAGTEGSPSYTNAQIADKLFGGGGGLNIRGDAVDALKATKEALGASSPEWSSLRQAALVKLAKGLDTALATNQTPPITTTSKWIANAIQNSPDGLRVLFSPDELSRLSDAQAVLSNVAPPGVNRINASGSGITSGRVLQGLMGLIAKGMKAVPYVGEPIANGMENSAAKAALEADLNGGGANSYDIAKRLASFAAARNAAEKAGAAGGAAYAPTEMQNEPMQ